MSSAPSIASFKRKYPRRLFNGAVGVLYKGTYEVTNGLSLGEGGMAFLWPKALPIDDTILVTFKIPGDTMIAVRGDLRNSKKWDQDPNIFVVGVQFLPLPIAEKRRIRAFVSSRLETEPII